MISAYVDHPEARCCNALSVSGDVLSCTLHDTGGPAFFARVEKIRFREISLVPNPVNNNGRVLRRELPSPMSSYVALSLQKHDLMIRSVKMLQKQFQLLAEMTHG